MIQAESGGAYYLQNADGSLAGAAPCRTLLTLFLPLGSVSIQVTFDGGRKVPIHIIHSALIRPDDPPKVFNSCAFCGQRFVHFAGVWHSGFPLAVRVLRTIPGSKSKV